MLSGFLAFAEKKLCLPKQLEGGVTVWVVRISHQPSTLRFRQQLRARQAQLDPQQGFLTKDVLGNHKQIVLLL